MAVSSTGAPAAVWLIHGTWARRAKWKGEASPMRAALRAKWGGPLDVTAFEWTGRNRARDRDLAARELAAAVVAAGDSGPRFAIAHSHGGNVTLQAALAEPSLFDGIVTLNTPFLSAKPRNNLLVLLNFALVDLALFAIAYNGLLAILGRALGVVEYVVLGALLGAILVVTTIALILGFRRRESGVVTHFGMDMVLYPRGIHPRVLCIGYADDEAVGWLGALDTLSSLPGLLLHRIAFPLVLLLIAGLHYAFTWELAGPSVLFNISRFMSEYGAVWGNAAVAGFLDRIALQNLALLPDDVRELSDFFWTYGSPGLFLRVFPLSVLSYFVTFWALVGLAAFLAGYFVRAVAFGEGFGMAAIASAFMTRLAVSATPMVPCRLDVIHVNEERSRWLRHSDVYDNSTVIEEIVGWMRDASRMDAPAV